MINSIRVTNYLGEVLTIDLANPYKTGLAISDITGLGAPEANIYVTELATTDGSIFNSSKAKTRNIVMTFRLIPVMDDPKLNSVEKVRQNLYKYFPIRKSSKIEFHTDTRKGYVIGYIEKNEATIFSTKGEPKNQISIICTDPFFHKVSTDVSDLSTFHSVFSFPFSNNSLTEDEIYLSYDSGSDTTQDIYYMGDANASIFITIKFYNVCPVKDFVIYNLTDNESYFKFNAANFKLLMKRDYFAKDDTLIISTGRGNKYAHLIINSKVYNLINSIDKGSTWFTLLKGDNYFYYSIPNKMPIDFKIETDTLYEGL